MHDPQLLDAIQKLQSDFTLASKLLKILTVDGRLVPFTLNNPQAIAHKMIEEQRSRTGMVRKVILKARRQGFSTYCMARNFHGTIFNQGVTSYCLTHHGDTTAELYKMVRRFIEYMPPQMGMSADKDTAKGFYFSSLQSGMSVGTAGGQTVGHGFGITRFHGSEVSRWPNAVDHFDGIMQAVSTIQGTEIILESVGGERGNLWHSLWSEAIAGKSKFEPIFIPWYTHSDYQLSDLTDYSPNDEDLSYQRTYKLSNEQMAWRQAKLSEFPVDAKIRFASMYPAIADEAFIRLEGGYINSLDVIEARSVAYAPIGPLIFGIDVGGGRDRTALIRRKGKVAYGLETTLEADPMAVAGWVARRIERDKPAAVFMDASGASVGNSVCARLNELGFKVTPVQFGGSADEPTKFVNKKAEIWWRTRDWLMAGAELPDSDELENDLLAPNKISEDSSGRERQEGKDALRARGVKSPDTAEALALTFSYPVAENVKSVIAPKSQEDLIHESAFRKNAVKKGGLGKVF
jgi:hypothetical protein